MAYPKHLLWMNLHMYLIDMHCSVQQEVAGMLAIRFSVFKIVVHVILVVISNALYI